MLNLNNFTSAVRLKILKIKHNSNFDCSTTLQLRINAAPTRLPIGYYFNYVDSTKFPALYYLVF